MRRYGTWLAAILTTGVLLRWWLAWHGTLPFVDDAFYVLGVARHLALGHGMISHGGIPTNGFMPLYVFAMVPVYWLMPQDAVMPLYIAGSLLALCHGLAGAVLARLVHRSAGPLVALLAAVFWSFAPHAIIQSLNGMETAVAVLALLLVLDRYLTMIRERKPPWPVCVAFGGLCGLAYLARFDTLLFVLMLFLDFTWHSLTRLRSGVRAWTQASLGMLLGGVLVTAPWLLLNWRLLGSLALDAGRAVHWIMPHLWGRDPAHIPWTFYLQNIQWGLTGVGDLWYLYTLRRLLGLPPYAALLLYAALAVALAWCAVTPRMQTYTRTLHRIFPVTLSLLAGCLGLFCAYTLYFFGGSYYPRYLFPLWTIALMLGAIIGGLWIQAGRAQRRQHVLACVILGALVFSWCVDGPRLRASDFRRTGFYAISRWLEDHTPTASTIGALNSGVIGYFCPRRVLNLDGVVNRHALHAIQRRQLGAYLAQEGVDYVVPYPHRWEYLVRELFGGWPSFADGTLVHTVGPWSVYRIGQTR